MVPPMLLWTRIADAIAALAQGQGLSAIFDQLRTPPERSAAFAIAVIALGAKMAKADGLVTRDEVTAFREVFQISKAEETNAARVYNLARQDIAGFEDYAQKIKAMYGAESETLTDLFEGLFYIALADGSYHPGEDDFLTSVAGIFGFNDQTFSRLRAQFVPDAMRDPYDVLGVSADAPLADVKAAWRTLVRDSHPDRMLARGVPVEALQLAEKRLIAVNQAWESIQGARP